MTVRRTEAVSTEHTKISSRDHPTLEELFLQLSLGDFDFDRLVDLLLVPALVIGIVLDGRGEEGVDEGRLA